MPTVVERRIPVFEPAFSASPHAIAEWYQRLGLQLSIIAETNQMAAERATFKETAPNPNILYAFLMSQLYRAHGVITPKKNTRVFNFMFNLDQVAGWHRLMMQITVTKAAVDGTQYLVYRPECIDENDDIFIDLMSLLAEHNVLNRTLVPFAESVYYPDLPEQKLNISHQLEESFPWSQFFFLFLLNVHTQERNMHQYLTSTTETSINPETFDQLLYLYASYHSHVPVFCKRTSLLNQDIAWLYRKFLELRDQPDKWLVFSRNLLKTPIIGVRLFAEQTALETALQPITNQVRQWNNTLAVLEKPTAEPAEPAPERDPILPHKIIQEMLARYAVYLYTTQQEQLTPAQLNSIFMLAGAYLHQPVTPEIEQEYKTFVKTYFAEGLTEDSLLIFWETHPYFNAAVIQFLEQFAQV